MIPLLVFLIRRFIARRKNAPGKLFEALRKENNGQLESALPGYEKALGAASKAGSTGQSLRATIIEKLKILHMVIAYHNHFIPSK